MKVAIAFAVAALALLATAVSDAHEFTSGAIHIIHPWARATPGGANVGGGFLVIENTGTVADRLIGGSLVSAGTVEIHEMSMAGDVMKMRQLADGLEIKPGEKVTLQPGGYHMMFVGLSQPLKEGDSVEGALVFKKAGTIKVTFKVEAIGAKGGDHPGHGAPAKAHDGKH